MNTQKERVCNNNECDKKFIQYKSTDKYCSFSCRNKSEKQIVKKQRKHKCANSNCENLFFKQKTTDKYCSASCKPKKENKIYITVKKEIKEKECKSNDCDNVFVQYKSTDKYCSLTCEIKDLKTKVSRYESIKAKIIKKKNKKSNAFEIEYIKSKKKLKDSILEEHGRLICEKCKCSSSIQFSTHHIVFRSELPNHIELNNLRNLIHLCYDCHESFHKNKKSRNYLITERNLTELFGSLWGYFKED